MREWWTVFRDPELDRLSKAPSPSPIRRSSRNEANYREALALINEARAGLFPTINGNASAVRSSPTITTLTAEATGPARSASASRSSSRRSPCIAARRSPPAA